MPLFYLEVNMVLFDLKQAIIKSGFKQGFIAQRAGIEETRLSKAIYGHRRLSKNYKQRLAQALDLRVKDLFPQIKKSEQFKEGRK